jgi:UDP-N-acetylmuramate dehydrogenase
VRYRLRPGGPPTLRYADVEKHLEDRRLAAPTLADVRASVLAIRRTKSMVLDDPGDPNRRSCGSFFTNPIVTTAELAEIDRRVGERTMPRWPQPDGRVKLSAAWLIERAGFTRGHRHGVVGLSTRHALAIVCHEGARARDVLDFARHLQAAVADRCGARLSLEPVVWDQASR